MVSRNFFQLSLSLLPRLAFLMICNYAPLVLSSTSSLVLCCDCANNRHKDCETPSDFKILMNPDAFGKDKLITIFYADITTNPNIMEILNTRWCCIILWRRDNVAEKARTREAANWLGTRTGDDERSMDRWTVISMKNYYKHLTMLRLSPPAEWSVPINCKTIKLRLL